MQFGILLLFLCVSLCSSVPADAAGALTSSGCSVSNVGYLSDLARQYEKESGVKMLVRGGGSRAGLIELVEDKVDFAASCKSRGSDDPSDFEFIPVAWDALVFIVNRSNPVSDITPENVRAIYEGRITNWKPLGGPDLRIKSFISTWQGMGGIGEALSRYILQGGHLTRQATSSMQASSVAIWEQLVERTPEGFASTGFASARKRHVKMLGVNGIVPNKKNIISGRYPYKRYLYLVVKKNTGPEVRKFIDFALSKKGQRFISSYGIPSLAEIK